MISHIVLNNKYRASAALLDTALNEVIIASLRLDDMEVVFTPACVNVGIAGILFFLSFVMGFQRPCRVALVLLKPQNCVLCHSAPFPIPFLSGVFHSPVSGFPPVRRIVVPAGYLPLSAAHNGAV